MSWNVSIVCGLCSAKTHANHADEATATAMAEARAVSAGFVKISAVKDASRVRHETWTCKACSGDVTVAFLSAGRGAQIEPTRGALMVALVNASEARSKAQDAVADSPEGEARAASMEALGYAIGNEFGARKALEECERRIRG